MYAPRKRPRQQRSRHTVEVILEAAAQLFHRDGYGATSTNHVAERAGVSIGSVYQYFPNKDALLLALAERHLEAALRGMGTVFDEIRGAELGLEDAVHVLVGAVAALHLDRPELHQLLFDQAPRVPELVARLRDGERHLAALFADELRRVGRGGPDPEVTALLAVQGIEAQMHGAFLRPPASLDRDAVVEAVTALWCRALAEPLAPMPPRGANPPAGGSARDEDHRV
ncbi:TetR/AcrR family transcriptional regulator [Actinoalloteichus spitiensis]|uniref:TetR/AcrR family transcriptional regulator n=1 Tax=Actinoalloteichus spitiensis TaxID=252394 RepID=UPI00037C7A12|nr:TetR/AcrR family transcriptional regulator [Actinoalloteichus spitiensis]